MNTDQKLMLLQINDAIFPIGGYSHSYGLETYIQQGRVCDVQSAREYIQKRLGYNLLYTDFLAVHLAFLAAKEENLEKLNELEEIMEASRIPLELREASRKLGNRFIKTLHNLDASRESAFYQSYLKKREGKSTCHPCAYGTFCACMGMDEDEVLLNFMYAQTSAMVTNCVKAIPLSQSDGQNILYHLHSHLDELLSKMKTLGEEMLCLSTPGFDLRSIQHETLYSRIYMS